jgi:hypothetical protein
MDGGVGGQTAEGYAAVESNRFSEVPEVQEVPPAPLPAALREAMAEIEKLRAENEMLLNWINGDSDALTVLQSIYQSSESSELTRIKAASSAIAFERPKVSVAISVRGPGVLGECLDTARLKTVTKTINHTQ